MSNIEFREYNDDSRVVIIRREGEPLWQRPYTAEENAEADARAAKVANEETLRIGLEQNISTLITSVATLKAITDKANADIGPSDTKAVAREARLIARQLIALMRLYTKQTESADLGGE